MGIQFDGINNEIKSQTKIDFPGSVGIAGSLTYEDVANVDSLGIITARAGIDVTGGLVSGVSTGANKVYIDESEDDNAFYNIPFLDSATFGDQFHTLQVDHSSFQYNPLVNAILVNRISPQNGFPLQFDQAGSEKLRIGTAGQIGIAGANYGNAGQVLTSQGASSSVAWGDGGKVLQVIQDTRTSQVSFTQHSVFTAVSGLFVDITPSASSSKVLVMVSMTQGTTSNSMFVYRLLRDSTVLLPSTGSAVVSGTDYAGTFAGKNDGTRGDPVNFNFLDTPNTTSQVRYSLSVMHNSGTLTLNQRDGNYAGSSTMIAMEIGA